MSKCNDDSCDLSHCARCGSHMMGCYLEPGTVCDSCRMEEEQIRMDHITCEIFPEQEQVIVRRGGVQIGWVNICGGQPKLTLMSNYNGIAYVTFKDIDIIQDNWNHLMEFMAKNLVDKKQNDGKM